MQRPHRFAEAVTTSSPLHVAANTGRPENNYSSGDGVKASSNHCTATMLPFGSGTVGQVPYRAEEDSILISALVVKGLSYIDGRIKRGKKRKVRSSGQFTQSLDCAEIEQ